MSSVPKKNNAPAVTRAASILDLLMNHAPRALSLAEIHQTLKLNKSTAHSILESLSSSGLAEREAISGKWALGPKTLELGLSYSRSSASTSRFARVGAAIKAQCRESVYYAILRDGKVLISAAIEERSHALTIDALPGDLVPVHRSALGLALLSDTSEPEIRASYAEGDPSMDDADRACLVKECAKARENGYAFTNREREEGVCGVAVPVRDGTGGIRAAIGMAVPAQRMDLERRASLAAALLKGAAELSGDQSASSGGYS